MSDHSRLTFPDFRATGRDVEDLRLILPDMSDLPDPIPARVYTDSNLYLEPARNATHGAYIVEVGNSGMQGSLEECEAHLYGFCLCEVGSTEAQAELMAKAPRITREHWL